jgi:alpha-glucosidase
MCGPGAKTIHVPLSFLGAGQYQSTLVRDDAPDGSTVVVEPHVHTQKDTIGLELRAGGGFVGRFSSGSGR